MKKSSGLKESKIENVLQKRFEAIKETAAGLGEQAREEGSKLGARLVSKASDMGLDLLHKASGKSAEAPSHAIALLKMDHEKVKGLFDAFEAAEDSKSKKKIVDEALLELKVHAAIEENLFYPAVRKKIDDSEGIMEEADEEHHVAKVLIAELEKMRGTESHYDAKFIVLAENVRHHIKEEEGEMLPEAAKTDIDFNELGARMAQMKQRLLANGVLPDAEAKMIKKSGLRGDSPAKKARKTIKVPKKHS